MEIREASPEEHGEAGEVAYAAYAEFYGDTLGSYGERIRDVATRAASTMILVAIRDGVIAGTVTYVADAASPYAEDLADDEAGIRMLAVHPAHKRRGVGRALSLACIERARADGKRAVVLHADEIMTASRALYETLGFERRPSRDFDPDEVTHLVCYELAL